jgi:hypothetical protein
MGKRRPIVVDGRNIVDPDEYMECGFVYRRGAKQTPICR